MWRYELRPPHLINVAIVPCESQNTEKCNNTVGKLHQMYRIASSKWTCRLWNLGYCAVMRVRNKALWHQWPAKMLNVNSVWFSTECYQGCDCQVARPSEIMCACWWWTLWTHAVKLLFICIIWFIRTFCETFNVIRCIWRLFRSWHKKLNLCSHAFSVFQL